MLHIYGTYEMLNSKRFDPKPSWNFTLLKTGLTVVIRRSKEQATCDKSI